eukprot:365228-Chlamydomonas_euryale.AAC.10
MHACQRHLDDAPATLRGQEHVRALDISVPNPVGVQVPHGRQQLPHNVLHICIGQLPLRWRVTHPVERVSGGDRRCPKHVRLEDLHLASAEEVAMWAILHGHVQIQAHGHPLASAVEHAT